MTAVFQQGGWMMWPLLALSALACGVIFERAMFYAALGHPTAKTTEALNAALARRDARALVAALPASHPVFGAFFDELRRLCASPKNPADAEQILDVLDIHAQEIADRLDRRLPFLGVVVRAAPLMGLLGTVLGMINTFSRLAAAQGGVDLMLLAEGIWQALLTTAAGLVVAIPVLLAQYVFAGRKRRVLEALRRAVDAAFAITGSKSRAA